DRVRQVGDLLRVAAFGGDLDDIGVLDRLGPDGGRDHPGLVHDAGLAVRLVHERPALQHLELGIEDRKSTRLNSSHERTSYAVGAVLVAPVLPYATLFRSTTAFARSVICFGSPPSAVISMILVFSTAWARTEGGITPGLFTMRASRYASSMNGPLCSTWSWVSKIGRAHV